MGTWEMYKKDERICDTEMARHQLYIVIEGRVDIDFRYEGSATAGRVNVGSGECFDLRVLNVCGVYLGFHNEVFVATAHQCTCFVLPLDGLVELITKHGHFLAFMRTYLRAGRTLSRRDASARRGTRPRLIWPGGRSVVGHRRTVARL